MKDKEKKRSLFGKNREKINWQQFWLDYMAFAGPFVLGIVFFGLACAAVFGLLFLFF